MVLRLPLLAALFGHRRRLMVVNQQRRPPFRLHASVEEKASSKLGKPGTAKMDVPWQDLGFEFRLQTAMFAWLTRMESGVEWNLSR